MSGLIGRSSALVRRALVRQIRAVTAVLTRVVVGDRVSWTGQIPRGILSVVSVDRGGYLHVAQGFGFMGKPSIAVRSGGRCSIGNGVFINRNVTLVCRLSVSIGDNVLIGPGVSIFDHDHDFGSEDPGAQFICAPIEIGAGSWIGAGAVILKGVSIGEGSVVGANAVVTRSVAPNTVVGGVPARPLGPARKRRDSPAS